MHFWLADGHLKDGLWRKLLVRLGFGMALEMIPAFVELGLMEIMTVIQVRNRGVALEALENELEFCLVIYLRFFTRAPFAIPRSLFPRYFGY